MSFDLFVCDPTPPYSDEDVHALFERASEGLEVDDATESTPRVNQFLAAIHALYPALEDCGDDAAENSPWAVSPTLGDRFVIFSLRWSAGDDVLDKITSLADAHALVLLDPQDGTVYRPGASG